MTTPDKIKSVLSTAPNSLQIELASGKGVSLAERGVAGATKTRDECWK